ncbi:MAG: hypothetical protein O9342_07270 [Beijerinckiaceae bacterium]|nr:hypothetical protein [Beijerinckiaceae bacterium]
MRAGHPGIPVQIHGRVLPRFWMVLLPLLFLSACMGDVKRMREGAGTTLAWEGQSDAMAMQDQYLGQLCVQAGFPGPAETCRPTRPSDWKLIVQAGLNDIDARCDAYLAWLDDKRRSARPIQQQLADARTATTAILAASGVGVDPIAIVSAAFGFATSSFTNFQSRLVLEVNHSTVQSIVLGAQRRLREEIRPLLITNRPDAVHAMRQYLRLCMPFTIETEINTTLTTLERGGMVRSPLIDGSTIEATIIGSAGDPVGPVRPPPPPPPKGEPLGAYEVGLRAPLIRQFETIACLKPSGALTKPVREGLLAFLNGNNSKGEVFKDPSEKDRLTPLDGAIFRQMKSDGVTCKR